MVSFPCSFFIQSLQIMCKNNTNRSNIFVRFGVRSKGCFVILGLKSAFVYKLRNFGGYAG